MLFAVHRGIIRNDPQLPAWRALLLNVSYIFEVVPTADLRFWRAQNLREELVEKGVVSKMTTLQRIYDVAGFKAVLRLSIIGW